MNGQFHLSTVVPDLAAAREFYESVLHCSVTRDEGSWMDVDFFGHQLTLHQQSETRTAIAIDHFGPVLDQACWRDLTRRVMAAGIEFEMPPTTLPGPSSCQKRGKFILKDPAGNLLEFKFIGESNRE